MITIHIYYKGENGNAKKFAQEMISSGIVNDIRAQSGNIRYEYFLPFQENETVLLIDSWENQSALDIHHASPMMSQIMALREKYNITMKVERYITDENGIPEKDKTFINHEA